MPRGSSCRSPAAARRPADGFFASIALFYATTRSANQEISPPIRSCQLRAISIMTRGPACCAVCAQRELNESQLAAAVAQLISDAHAGWVVVASPVPNPRPCKHDLKRQHSDPGRDGITHCGELPSRLRERWFAHPPPYQHRSSSVCVFSAAASLERNSISLKAQVISGVSLSLTRM